MRRFRRLLHGASFAGRDVQFAGSSREVYPHFALTWTAIVALLAIQALASDNLDPTSALFGLQITLIGVAFFFGVVLAMAYYNARLFARVAESITIDGVTFRFDATTLDLITLYFTNLFMNMISAGFSYYYSRMRIARFIARHLQISGDLARLRNTGDACRSPEGGLD